MTVQAKLRKELDAILGTPGSDCVVATYEQLKNVTYLQDVINEGMRLHSTVGIGLPRIVPENGLTIAGELNLRCGHGGQLPSVHIAPVEVCLG